MGAIDGSAEPEAALQFPIVGIGASAGGLEALKDVFTHLRDGSSLAFFVVQHLSPDFKSMMVEILQRHTRLQVLDAQDGIPVLPGNVYMLPPKKEISLDGERIRLVDRPKTGGLHLPIDLFLTSLAETQQEMAVAVILSGTGTDGSRGVRAIQQHGGLVLVQDPTTAKFDGMPRSAVATGAADFVLSLLGIAEQLHHVQNPRLSRLVTSEAEPFRKVLSLVARETRVDLTLYKEGTLQRRIERRLQMSDVPSLAGYAEQLENDPDELQALCVDLLIGVTDFFRDPEAWEIIQSGVLPDIVDNAKEIRLWSAGCSTGAEAYTLAISMLEVMEARGNSDVNLRVFATDASQHAVRTAMTGEYTEQELAGLPVNMREKYFERYDGRWRVRRFLRDSLTFAVHNVMTDPPFTRLDLVSCRNLLIYLQPEGQRAVLARLHFGLREGGVLFLGPSETVGEQKSAFENIHLKWKIFRAVGASAELTQALGSSSTSGAFQPRSRPRIATATDNHVRAAVEYFVPPGVAIDAAMDVVHLFGDASQFIQLPSGRPTLNLVDLLPAGVAVFINSTARRVRATGTPALIPDVELNGQRVRIRIVPSLSPSRGEELGLLVFFEVAEPGTEAESTALELPAESAARITELREELVVTRENLRTAVEDLEATNEELQATNEELIASNEELQSTNEELQSVNEELFTVNTEYQEKIDELEFLNGDLENLLRSIEVGALFLDATLRVRRFNSTVLRLLSLRREDVGRSLTDLMLHADYPEFHAHVTQVLETREPVSARTVGTDGTAWTVHIRPFDHGHRHEGGVIVTFHDETAWQEHERRIGDLTASEMAAGLAGVGMVLLEPSTGSTRPSATARKLLGLNDEEQISMSAMQELLMGQGVETEGENVSPVDSLRSYARPDGSTAILRVFAQRLQHAETGAEHVVVALQQVRA